MIISYFQVPIDTFFGILALGFFLGSVTTLICVHLYREKKIQSGHITFEKWISIFVSILWVLFQTLSFFSHTNYPIDTLFNIVGVASVTNLLGLSLASVTGLLKR